MSTGRTNPFADMDEMPVLEPKPRAPKPIAPEAIEKIAAANNFPSRQAAPPPVSTPPRARRDRRYRTGRNQQLNIKATSETIERFYKLADAERTPHGELLDRALDALEKVTASAAG